MEIDFRNPVPGLLSVRMTSYHTNIMGMTASDHQVIAESIDDGRDWFKRQFGFADNQMDNFHAIPANVLMVHRAVFTKQITDKAREYLVAGEA